MRASGKESVACPSPQSSPRRAGGEGRNATAPCLRFTSLALLGRKYVRSGRAPDGWRPAVVADELSGPVAP